MSAFSPKVLELIEALRNLPGVGPKSAQRTALHLLQRNRGAARRLAAALESAAEQVGECDQCRMLTEADVCGLCADPRRDGGLICVVETAGDVVAIENATDYPGRYFVLGGRLSPLDGVGPADLGLERLAQRLSAGGIHELILALTTTAEGEATSHYISEMAAERGVATTRIAHGVPMGGELEQVDRGTLSHAFMGRRHYEQ